MPKPITLTKEAEEELETMAHTFGFTREEAVHYAARLINACVREGLLTDVPERLWPEEAAEGVTRLSSGEPGKVLAFRRRG